MEIWKDIDGYTGYQISSYGNVRTYNKITYSNNKIKRVWKDRILKQKISKKDNIHRVILWLNGKPKTFTVHRLVAEAFLGKCPNMTVNHKDGNRHNNHIENLEWLSNADNIRYGFNNNQYSTCKKCALINAECRYEFNSISEACRFLGRNTSYICMALKLNNPIMSVYGEKYNFELLV